jgi:broad specificity phosphatase PhoE
VILRRTLLAASAGLPLAAAARGETEGVWQALRSDGHVALMRHGLAPGTFDPPGFKLDDCATQRNLSAEGRSQASRAGDLFRRNGVVAARVFSSEWCRCLETARLLSLGAVTAQPLLNFHRQGSRTGPGSASDPERVEALRAWISRQDLASPHVLVTHGAVIAALFGAYADSGEIIVVRRGADGALAVAGRIPTA